MHKLRAKFALAITFFIHLFKRVLFIWKREENAERFLNYFRADGIHPIDKTERKWMPLFQRCQACSLCIFTCEPIREGNAPPGFEPKFIMLGLGRSSHESEIFLEEWMPCAQCSKCTVNCPNQVPIHAMAERIIERRKSFGFRKL